MRIIVNKKGIQGNKASVMNGSFRSIEVLFAGIGLTRVLLWVELSGCRNCDRTELDKEVEGKNKGELEEGQGQTEKMPEIKFKMEE